MENKKRKRIVASCSSVRSSKRFFFCSRWMNKARWLTRSLGCRMLSVLSSLFATLFFIVVSKKTVDRIWSYGKMYCHDSFHILLGQERERERERERHNLITGTIWPRFPAFPFDPNARDLIQPYEYYAEHKYVYMYVVCG